ncbi:MAG: HAD family hydrolase, partial [Anaerolineales bacterium]
NTFSSTSAKAAKSAKGIVVGNADVELKRLKGPNIYHANNNYAAGVLEGLYYWGVISKS